MNKEFVPYEEALALKELGFDEPCFGEYDNGSTRLNVGRTFNNSENRSRTKCALPLYQQAFRWFREKYMLYHSINPLGYNMCLGSVGGLGGLKECNADKGHYGTYEEAELACLRKLIEIVKEKL